MESLYRYSLVALLMALPGPVFAQLLPDQRVLDFQSLVALYEKRYAPYGWKRLAFGVDMFAIQPWLNRVRAAKDDLEFFEIEAEYVASLNDTHSGFQMSSSYRANLGITVDIYDGKVLIDSINRAALPIATFPIQIGDEVVSVDGKTAEDWITRISAWRRFGNPVSTRRLAAGQITFRTQATFPRAIEIGDSANVEIRRAGGNVETFIIPWTKSGVPVTSAGPVPFPSFSRLSSEDPDLGRDYEKALDELHSWKLPANELALMPIPWTQDENGNPRTFVNGVGSPAAVFRGGFPASFIQRLGRVPTDFNQSGTYQADGLTIGYLRIPSFSPPNMASAVNELNTEIDFFQKNTDGLVVDVTRNPGGGCYMLDVAAHLIPYPFYFFGEQVRVTQDRVNSYQSLVEAVTLARAPQWIIDTYQLYLQALKAMLPLNGALTGPIPACAQFGTGWAPIMNNNPPAAVVYSKPMIVLIDEFSISAADIFPSMIQDNARAKLVGARTSGGGGSVSGWQTGYYSESISTNTNSLVVRKDPIVTTDLPTAPYVENIGARPDVPLDFMTRENLLNGGRTFVDQFTQILISEIKK